MNRARIALSIDASDSGGGSGIQGDIKTFSALGVYGASVITAVAAQDTSRIYERLVLEPDFVVAQIDAVMGDIGADAVKTGLLATASLVDAVANRLQRWSARNIVVDPIAVDDTGQGIIEDDALRTLRDRLLPLATILTPNIAEAELLLGRTLDGWDDIREAARDLHKLGAANVVIKGGHRREAFALDILYDGAGFHEFTTGRVSTTSSHGAGGAFAAAIAATLAKGEDVRHAVASGKAYVTKGLQAAYPIGQGTGPLHHFYRYWRPTEDKSGQV